MIRGQMSTKHTITLLLQVWEQLRPVLQVGTWRDSPNRTKAIDFHVYTKFNLFNLILRVSEAQDNYLYLSSMLISNMPFSAPRGTPAFPPACSQLGNFPRHQGSFNVPNSVSYWPEATEMRELCLK